jgi:hypothetical protein
MRQMKLAAPPAGCGSREYVEVEAHLMILPGQPRRKVRAAS